MPGSPRRSYWPISQSRISGDSSFVEKPINSGLFEREHGCPTRWAGRTPPMFHNTLVVGSSPTSSTTQSPLTGEISVEVLVQRPPLQLRFSVSGTDEVNAPRLYRGA